MIYICYKPSSKWNHFEVEEAENEKEAVKFIEEKHLPQTRIFGIFLGTRLVPQVGEKRVIKKTVVGFNEANL